MKKNPQYQQLSNPFTRKYKVLDTLEYRDHGQLSFGFSFDEANDDYKVVRILVSNDPQQHPNEVNVYSLKLTSWRRINDFPFNGYSLESVGCFVDGGFNWLASNLSKSLSVVSYNLELEEFNEITILVSVHIDEDCNVDLQAMDGKLCLLEVYHPISIDLWVLVNHWMKMYSLLENGVLTNLMDIKLLSCSKNGQRILLSDNKDLIWYDLLDNTSKRVTVRGFPPHPHFDAHMCFEYLVSLGDDSLFDEN
ncbi:hypothetical protein Q3G72_013854 [Acer saccharum]|nr:hypothetical protein Q3G72_013854 [Acer saccharum]